MPINPFQRKMSIDKAFTTPMPNQNAGMAPIKNPLTPGQTTSQQGVPIEKPKDSALQGVNAPGLATGPTPKQTEMSAQKAGVFNTVPNPTGGLSGVTTGAGQTQNLMGVTPTAPVESMGAVMNRGPASRPGQRGTTGQQATLFGSQVDSAGGAASGLTGGGQIGQQEQRGGSTGEIKQKESEPSPVIQGAITDAYQRQADRQRDWDEQAKRRDPYAGMTLDWDATPDRGKEITGSPTGRMQDMKPIEPAGTLSDDSDNVTEPMRGQTLGPSGEILSQETKDELAREAYQRKLKEGLDPREAYLWGEYTEDGGMAAAERMAKEKAAQAADAAYRERINRMKGAGGSDAMEVLGNAAATYNLQQAMGEISSEEYNRKMAQLSQAQGLAGEAAARAERTDTTFQEAARYFNEQGYTLTADGRLIDKEGHEVFAKDLPPELRQRYEEMQYATGGQTPKDQEAIQKSTADESSKARHELIRKDIEKKGVTDTDVSHAYAAAVNNGEIKTDKEKEQWLLDHGYQWSEVSKQWEPVSPVNESRT